jgi:hypothetical protein
MSDDRAEYRGPRFPAAHSVADAVFLHVQAVKSWDRQGGIDAATRHGCMEVQIAAVNARSALQHESDRLLLLVTA